MERDKERVCENTEVVEMNIKHNPIIDLISNMITEMICQDCSIEAIKDAVILSKVVIDNIKKEK